MFIEWAPRTTSSKSMIHLEETVVDRVELIFLRQSCVLRETAHQQDNYHFYTYSLFLYAYESTFLDTY